jgi:hypothetical protein
MTSYWKAVGMRHVQHSAALYIYRLGLVFLQLLTVLCLIQLQLFSITRQTKNENSTKQQRKRVHYHRHTRMIG